MSNQNCNILPRSVMKGRTQIMLWLGPKWRWTKVAPRANSRRMWGSGSYLRHPKCFAGDVTPAADICEGLLVVWVSKSNTCDTRKRSFLLLLATASLFCHFPANFLQTIDWKQYAGYTLPSSDKCQLWCSFSKIWLYFTSLMKGSVHFSTSQTRRQHNAGPLGKPLSNLSWKRYLRSLSPPVAPALPGPALTQVPKCLQQLAGLFPETGNPEATCKKTFI